MQCGPGDDGWLLNADLFDVWPSEATAAQQLAEDDLFPCPFNRAALLAGAVAALLFHLVHLAHALSIVARLVYRFHASTTTERWWNTFAGRYCLLVIAMTMSVIAFNCLRIASLTRGTPPEATGSPLLALSFSPRAGGSVGASAPLFIGAVAFIGAMAFSVRNTVQASVAASAVGVRGDSSPRALPSFIRHFTAFCLGLFAFNAVVWALLFALPSAAQSSSPDTAQLVIALLLMSLGSVSYWSLARSVSMATKLLSESLRIRPMLPFSPGRGSEVAPVLQQRLSAEEAGLNSEQVERRKRQSLIFHVSSLTIRAMLLLHQTVTVALFISCLLLPSYHLQAYWLYFAQCHWVLVTGLRLQVLVIPHPS